MEGILNVTRHAVQNNPGNLQVSPPSTWETLRIDRDTFLSSLEHHVVRADMTSPPCPDSNSSYETAYSSQTQAPPVKANFLQTHISSMSLSIDRHKQLRSKCMQTIGTATHGTVSLWMAPTATSTHTNQTMRCPSTLEATTTLCSAHRCHNLCPLVCWNRLSPCLNLDSNAWGST